VVYGGTRYIRELERADRYLTVFVELGRINKAVKINDSAVDKQERRVSQKVNDKAFDDAHLIAILSVSRCRLICTTEKRAIPFLKDSSLYPKGVKRPKIYSRREHRDLLCDANIADCCR